MLKLLFISFLFIVVNSQLPRGDQWPVTGKDYQMSYVNDNTDSHTFASAVNISVVWKLDLPSVPGAPWPPTVPVHPAVVRDKVYFADTLGRLYKYDLKTNQFDWNVTLSTNLTDRGTIETFQTTPVVTQDSVFISFRNIFRVNGDTGEVIWKKPVSDDTTSVGPDGRLTDYYTYTGDITVVDGYVIVGSGSTQNEITPGMLVNPNNTDLTARGSVVCFDEETGTTLWRLYTTSDQLVPNPQYGAGVSPWSSPSIDRSRYTVYIGTGNTFEPPASPYTNSLLAIDYRTGELLWQGQGKADDVYGFLYPSTAEDRDFSTHPNLFTLRVKLSNDSRPHRYDFVNICSKDGNCYIYDADQDTINATALAILSIDFGSTLGGVQSTPAIKDGIMYVSSHAVVDSYIDPMTNQTVTYRRGINGSLGFSEYGKLSQRLTAVNLTEALQNPTYSVAQDHCRIVNCSYVLWRHEEAPGLFKLSYGPTSITQDILFRPSYAGYIDIFSLNGTKSSKTLVPSPGLGVNGAVTISNNYFCTGYGTTFLGFNTPGGIICYA